MGDQEEIINQLFEKINHLEEKNKTLRSEIQTKKNELKNLNKTKNNTKKNESNSQKEKKITKEEDKRAAEMFKNEINSLQNNSLQIQDNLVEYKIEFIPEKLYGKIYILGDFTNWDPILMKKNYDTFYFTVVLMKGFKYYYNFLSSEENCLLDYNSTYDKNPSNQKLQNFLDIKRGKNKSSLFDCKTDMNILKMAQRNFLLLKINDDMYDILFLEKFKRHVVNKKKSEKFLEDPKQTEKSITSYYDNTANYLLKNIFEDDKLKNIQNFFLDRILISNSPKFDTVQYQNKIIAVENNYVYCIRLYDHNEIKLDLNYYYLNYLEECLKVNFNEIVSRPLYKREKYFQLVSKNESEEIINHYENDNENIIKVYFRSENNLTKSNSLVKPEKIEPEDVTLTDYDYCCASKILEKVVNKDDESHVLFDVYIKGKKVENKNNNNNNVKNNTITNNNNINNNVVKNEINTNKNNITNNEKEINKISNNKINDKNDENKKEIKNTINIKDSEITKKPKEKVIQYEIYYTLYKNKILILHYHILDEEIPDPKFYMKGIDPTKTDPHKLKHDKKYNSPDLILLLTSQNSLYKLYYKGKKVHFTSIQIKQDKLYYINQDDSQDNFFNKMIVSIYKINNIKSLTYDLIINCEMPNEDYLNGVDCKCLYDSNKNEMDDDMSLAVCPCFLKELTEKEEKELLNKNKKNINNKNVENKSYEMQKYDLISKEMNKYKDLNEEKVKKMTRSEKDNIGITLDDYKTTMGMICDYVQRNEMWEYVDKVSELSAQIDNILDLIDNN